VEEAQAGARQQVLAAEEALARQGEVVQALEAQVAELRLAAQDEARRIEEAVAARLKAAVPSEEESKAIRYAAFRQGLIMGEANAQADKAMVAKDACVTAVRHLHQAATDAFAPLFKASLHTGTTGLLLSRPAAHACRDDGDPAEGSEADLRAYADEAGSKLAR
jgi:hypothetical protein